VQLGVTTRLRREVRYYIVLVIFVPGRTPGVIFF
jgi:hypothetical protein